MTSLDRCEEPMKPSTQPQLGAVDHVTAAPDQVAAKPIRSRPATPQQLSVLDYVRTYQARHQAPPTRREIAAHFGWKSATAAQQALRALERKGLLRLVTTSRGIEFQE